jgi:hypothetical protein
VNRVSADHFSEPRHKNKSTLLFVSLQENCFIMAPSDSQTCASTRSVSFDPRIEVVFETLALKDYSAAEISASWFDDDEYDAIVRTCEHVIDKLNKGTPFDEKNCCPRGLERMTKEGLKAVDQIRFAAFDAVLDEQQKQWEEGVDDQETIAALYQAVSFRAQQKANTLGGRDSHAVKSFLSSAENATLSCVAAAVPSLRTSHRRRTGGYTTPFIASTPRCSRPTSNN